MVDLSQFDWYAAGEVQRAHLDPPQSEGDVRSPFERDRARIIHSVAFRNLQGKTQIFAPSGGIDFMRTRVTHSIEVAQIGRALAERFKVPASLVEAACLGHDLGHPPFGHTGEQALNDVMRDHHLQFEGNAQTFHIVTSLEEKAIDYEGLDLTRATLLSLIKYPYTVSARAKKFIYDEDATRDEEWLYNGTGRGLLKKYEEGVAPPRTLPCQLMDWADDVAYSVHDLEDGIASGFLQPSTWLHSDFVKSVHNSVVSAPIRWQDGPPAETTVGATLESLVARLGGERRSHIPKDVVREFSRYYIDRFATAGNVEASGAGETSFDFRLVIPEELRVENQILKAITFEFVIKDHRTTTIAFNGRRIVRRLFTALFENTQSTAKRERLLLFPHDLREQLDSYGDDEQELARSTCDFIASMTEGRAVALYRRMFASGAGPTFELV